MTSSLHSTDINLIIENFPVLVYWKDTNLIYRGCNKNVANLLGYQSPDEIIGKTDHDLAKEFNWTSDRINHLKEMDKVILENGIEISEEDVIPINDDIKIYISNKKPLFKNGKIIGILGISTDVTEQKKIEEALKEAKEKNEIYLHGIVENLPQLVYWKDQNLIYQGCNHLCAQILNLKNPSEIIGKSDHDFGWSIERIEALHVVDRQILNGKSNVIEDIIPINNENRIFLTSKTPLLTKNGDIVGVLGISTDISDMKSMEEALKNSKEAAEAGERAKTSFIANMSHDLRTPLAGIIGEANILQDELSNEEQKEHAVHLAKSGSKLLSMYNEIIEDVTSGNMTEQSMDAETFDITALASDLQDLEMPTLVTKGLKFSAMIDADIPTFLVSDRRKIERIIENLLGNAIKFTKQGHIDLKIELLEKQEDAVKLKFNVIDTGIGVPDESKPKLFERFYKVSPSYKGEYQGFGLGLDIAKNYTHVLGGTIGFESTEGVGSDFYVILSIKIASGDEISQYKEKLANKPSALKLNKNNIPHSNPHKMEAVPEKTEKPLIVSPSINPSSDDTPRVLVIEDDMMARAMLTQMLKKTQLTYVQAEDGETGLELATTQIFDLILSDIGLPGISGLEFTTQFRTFEKANSKQPTPIVAVTAHAGDGSDECLRAGMNGVVSKPITREALADIIQTFLPDFKIPEQP